MSGVYLIGSDVTCCDWLVVYVTCCKDSCKFHLSQTFSCLANRSTKLEKKYFHQNFRVRLVGVEPMSGNMTRLNLILSHYEYKCPIIHVKINYPTQHSGLENPEKPVKICHFTHL